MINITFIIKFPVFIPNIVFVFTLLIIIIYDSVFGTFADKNKLRDNMFKSTEGYFSVFQ